MADDFVLPSDTPQASDTFTLPSDAPAPSAAQPPPSNGPITGTAPVSEGPLTWAQVPGQALMNAPRSALKTGEAIAQPFIHPIQTAENLSNVGQGVLEKFGIMSGDAHEKYADAVGKFFVDRYGNLENIKKTLAEDPVGALADLSTVLTAGETAAGRIPGIVGEVAQAVGTVGRTIDPITNAVKAVGAVAPGAGDAATLAQAGVRMTPGQLTGGIPKWFEDTLSSVPILGSFINSGRKASIESFDKAVANQALEPIGESVSRGTAAGHDLVREVERKLGDKYDSLLPNLQWIPDAQYGQDINNIIRRDVAILPKQQADQFQSILSSRVGPPAPMDGAAFKSVEGELTNIANNYRSSSDAAQRGLASALDKTVRAMRSNLERSNPAHAEELARANAGWAMFARIRQAASQRATSEGVFMPSDLLAAIKASDKTVGKGSFAKGDGLMQLFAETGQRVLPSKIPTSGTSERAAVMGTLASGFWLHNPALIAAGAAATLPYTRAGMWGINQAANIGRQIPGTVLGRAAYQAGRLPTQVDVNARSGYYGQKNGGRVDQQNGFAHGGTVSDNMRTIQVIRHGATKLNNDDVSVDRIRSWKNIPLSKEGEQEAHTLGDCMTKEVKPDILVSSNLKRAHDTARIVSKKIGVPIRQSSTAFRPWNLGNFAGQKSSQAVPVIADYATETPDKKVPGGESFNDFKRRFFTALYDLLRANKGIPAIVTHHRNERLLRAWEKVGYPADGSVDHKEFTKKGEHTAQMFTMQVPMDGLREAARARYASGGRVDEGKVSKASVNYRKGTLETKCELCQMFEQPHSCTAVRGHIAPTDLCDLFKRKSD